MTDTTKPQRPAVTPEMIQAAATEFAKREGWDDDQAADLVRVYRRNMGGYELAKELDDRCGWSITASDVESLDGFDFDVSEKHAAACKAWAEEHNIQPPLPLGTVTTRGTIESICHHSAATYLVCEPGREGQRRFLLVRFEDARAVEQGAPA